MSPERFRRLEELYHAARERTPEERAKLLAQTDAELRRELELLLAQASRCEFLDRPAIQNAPDLLEDSTRHASGGPNGFALQDPGNAWSGRHGRSV